MKIKSKKLHISYYAFLQERRGLSEETLESSASTALELYGQLNNKHQFQLSPERLRVAINDEFCSWQTAIRSGDHIVFIPPVSGG